MSRRPPKINGYNKIRHSDYVENKTVGETIYGLAEIEGKRSNQEDAIVYANDLVHPVMQQMQQMEDAEIRSSYENCFAEIQNEKGQVTKMGSTCCTAAAWINPETNILTAWTANLGDSAAYLVIITPATESVIRSATTRQLTNLHNPNQPKELERLDKVNYSGKYQEYKTVGAYVSDAEKAPPEYRGRLPNHLAVSRAFGDTDSEEFGLLHEPEIDKYEVALQENQTAYMLVGCNGAVGNALKPEDLGDIVYKDSDKPLGEIAEEIINRAYNSGSEDNISVGMFQVGSQVGSLTVIDGHGERRNKIGIGQHDAAAFSQDISEIFYPKLAAKINPDLFQHFAQQQTMSNSSASRSTQVDVKGKGKEKLATETAPSAGSPSFLFTINEEKSKPLAAPRGMGVFGGSSTQKTAGDTSTQAKKTTPKPITPRKYLDDDSFCSGLKLKKTCLTM